MSGGGGQPRPPPPDVLYGVGKDDLLFIHVVARGGKSFGNVCARDRAEHFSALTHFDAHGESFALELGGEGVHSLDFLLLVVISRSLLLLQIVYLCRRGDFGKALFYEKVARVAFVYVDELALFALSLYVLQ